MINETFFHTLIAVFIILNILDAHSTLKVIAITSYRSEKNPVARFLFKLIGPLAGVIVLKSILIPVIFLMFYYFSFQRKDITIVLSIASILYLLIVIHNYSVVKKIKKHGLLMDEMDISDE